MVRLRLWRKFALLVSIPILAVLLPDSASAQSRDHDRVYFWESPGFRDDGVALGPSPRSWDLRGVTRDCAIFCWNDWNNVPGSVYVTPNAVATVFTETRYFNGTSQGGGFCMHVRGGTSGRALSDLRFIRAGLPTGQNWYKQISFVYLHREGDHEPNCANG